MTWKDRAVIFLGVALVIFALMAWSRSDSMEKRGLCGWPFYGEVRCPTE